MTKPYRDGKYYRARAEECRTVGDILATAELREKMYKIAADYECMAVDADHAKADFDAADLHKLR